MDIVEIKEMHLIGLALTTKTINENGQSAKDCEQLWHQFHKSAWAEKITNKLSDEVLGVYHDYEGDSSKPFSYFIGYKVQQATPVPEGLQSLLVPAGAYYKISAKGKMPDCVSAAWQEIWQAGYPRTYTIDFEVYDERSKDWNNAEVDVYLSVNRQ